MKLRSSPRGLDTLLPEVIESKVTYDRPQGKVMFLEASVTHYVHNRSHGYLVTAHPCYNTDGIHPTGMFSCYGISTLHGNGTRTGTGVKWEV